MDEEIEAKFVGVDRKKRVLSLSIKAKDMDDEAAAIEEYGSSNDRVGGTLGDLMKEQMNRG